MSSKNDATPSPIQTVTCSVPFDVHTQETLLSLSVTDLGARLLPRAYSQLLGGASANEVKAGAGAIRDRLSLRPYYGTSYRW